VAWDIAVAGTVHLDEITTPAGHRTDQLGGSAVYFALAAARYATVHLNAIVGDDSAALFAELLDSAGVRREGLVVSDRATFRWHARHDFDRWVAVDTSSEEGCDPLWRPDLPGDAAAAPVLFVASMRPSLQREVLAQSRELLDDGAPLLVTVDVRAEEETLRLTAQRFDPLDKIVAQAAAGLKVVLGEGGALAQFQQLMTRESGGRGRVTVVVPVSAAREVEIALPGGFKIGPEILRAVRGLPGVLEVQDL